MQKNWSFHLWIAPLLVFMMGFSLASDAQVPKVGRRAAAKYFEKDREVLREPAPERYVREGNEVLMLSIGTFIGSKSYQWKGSDSRDNLGRSSYGVTYLYEEWKGLDMNIRADFNEYKLDDNRAVKLSLMPLITFPRAESHFPLYFGIGAGLGVFFQQVPDESNLSFDYQLIAGARFMDLFNNLGFFFELGLKNHLHLLSDGQFNGTALTAGLIFSF